jgi:hypothetical protein
MLIFRHGLMVFRLQNESSTPAVPTDQKVGMRDSYLREQVDRSDVCIARARFRGVKKMALTFIVAYHTTTDLSKYRHHLTFIIIGKILRVV